MSDCVRIVSTTKITNATNSKIVASTDITPFAEHRPLTVKGASSCWVVQRLRRWPHKPEIRVRLPALRPRHSGQLPTFDDG